MCLGIQYSHQNKAEITVAGMDKFECWIMSEGVMPGQYLIVAIKDKERAIYTLDYNHCVYQISGKTDLLLDATSCIDLTCSHRIAANFVNNLLKTYFSNTPYQTLLSNHNFFDIEFEIKQSVLSSKMKETAILDLVKSKLAHIVGFDIDLSASQFRNNDAPYIDWGDYPMSRIDLPAID